MNWDLRQYGLAVGCTAAIATVIALPAQAAQTEITGVQLTPVGQGFELMLKTQGNNRPPVFTVNRGNASVADISNAQLRLTTGATFTQANPAPGITSVEVRQLNSSTVRITVTGTNAAPISNTVRGDESQGILALRFNAAEGLETGAAAAAQPPSGAFPNATPPLQRRPVAPPVGDMAVGTINAEPDIIDLGSGQIIPKLLLRNAPVREVLTLLGRAAGVNVAFAEGDSAAAGATGDVASSENTISLDIENESVQDVFNYVLRLSGLDANKVGNTIFVGKELPGDAKNRVIRSIRLNQLRATAKTSFTNAIVNTSQVGGSTSGAQASITADGESASSSITGSNTSASLSTLGRLSRLVESFSEKGAKEVLESYGANNGGTGEEVAASTLLKGLEVVADARINSVTLIGTPRKVEIATSLLKQLDIRKRQVAVNVKMVDINLLKGRDFSPDIRFNPNGSLGFGISPDTNGNAGLGVIFGGLSGSNPFAASLTGITNQVLGSLFASIQNEDAKILTNPTLIIQEGSSAQVNLTQEIFSGLESTTNESASPSGGVTQAVSVKPIIRQAGVIFNVTVDRVDDNGFVTLNVSPEVSAPSGTFDFVFPGVAEGVQGTLLSQRRLETGKIRLRDGQTLVLTGIIQDTDRTTVSKVPILGDIPILGRLFRRESGEKSRRELVVIVTPQVMDDSDQATTGYQYAPSPDAQSFLNR